MNTVEQLRKQKYKVKVEHYRMRGSQFVPYSRKTKGMINNKGGITVVTITTPEGETRKGVATCAKEDHFNYRLGVKMAIERAFS